MTIEWVRKLHGVGHETIDEQHRRLIEQLALLIESTSDDLVFEDAARIFDFLDDYMEKHLALEERLMEETGCPAAEQNLREHAILRSRLGGFRSRFLRGKDRAGLQFEMRETLLDWFSEHIQEVDRQLVDYLPAATD